MKFFILFLVPMALLTIWAVFRFVGKEMDVPFAFYLFFVNSKTKILINLVHKSNS